MSREVPTPSVKKLAAPAAKCSFHKKLKVENSLNPSAQRILLPSAKSCFPKRIDVKNSLNVETSSDEEDLQHHKVEDEEYQDSLEQARVKEQGSQFESGLRLMEQKKTTSSSREHKCRRVPLTKTSHSLVLVDSPPEVGKIIQMRLLIEPNRSRCMAGTFLLFLCTKKPTYKLDCGAEVCRVHMQGWQRHGLVTSAVITVTHKQEVAKYLRRATA